MKNYDHKLLVCAILGLVVDIVFGVLNLFF